MQKFRTRFKPSWKVVFSRMKVVWRSYDSRVQSYEDRVQSYEDRVQSYEDRVQSYEDRVAERGKKLIRPSYVLTRLNTTFIRLSYDSHTPEHEIHMFVIRSEEPMCKTRDWVTKIDKNMSYEGLAQSYGDRVYFCSRMDIVMIRV